MGRVKEMPDLTAPEGIAQAQSDARINLLLDMERDFVSRNPGVSPQSHSTAYDRAVRLIGENFAARYFRASHARLH